MGEVCVRGDTGCVGENAGVGVLLLWNDVVMWLFVNDEAM
jgi:hypothetical protein